MPEDRPGKGETAAPSNPSQVNQAQRQKPILNIPQFVVASSKPSVSRADATDQMKFLPEAAKLECVYRL
jgi:hypothetical protein